MMYVIQYQYLREGEWYDDPYFSKFNEHELAKAKDTLIGATKAAGVRYRIIERDIITTEEEVYHL